MKQKEFTFTGVYGDSLFGQVWQPPGDPRAVMAIVHGLGEYSDRYHNYVQPLMSAGVEIWGFDLRGHGRSAGRRGHIRKWGDYRQDLDFFLKKIGGDAPGKKIFLFGHSLGSLIAADYILHDPLSLAGVILSGLATEPVGVATPTLIMVAKLLSRVWPTFSLPIGIKGGNLSHIPSVAKAYDEDPLIFGDVTVRFGAESLATIDFIKRETSRFALPLLIIHGGEDPLNAVSAAETFYQQAASLDKQLKIYPGTLHEPHNDEISHEVVHDVLLWIEAHIT